MHWSDPLIQEPGAKEGPTIQGILSSSPMIRAPSGTPDQTVKNSAFGEQSPRDLPDPPLRPRLLRRGKGNGRAARRSHRQLDRPLRRVYRQRHEIHGRIIPIGGIRDKTLTPAPPVFPKAIRLVKGTMAQLTAQVISYDEEFKRQLARLLRASGCRSAWSRGARPKASACPISSSSTSVRRVVGDGGDRAAAREQPSLAIFAVARRPSPT